MSCTTKEGQEAYKATCDAAAQDEKVCKQNHAYCNWVGEETPCQTKAGMEGFAAFCVGADQTACTKTYGAFCQWNGGGAAPTQATPTGAHSRTLALTLTLALALSPSPRLTHGDTHPGTRSLAARARAARHGEGVHVRPRHARHGRGVPGQRRREMRLLRHGLPAQHGG